MCNHLHRRRETERALVRRCRHPCSNLACRCSNLARGLTLRTMPHRDRAPWLGPRARSRADGSVACLVAISGGDHRRIAVRTLLSCWRNQLEGHNGQSSLRNADTTLGLIPYRPRRDASAGELCCLRRQAAPARPNPTSVSIAGSGVGSADRHRIDRHARTGCARRRKPARRVNCQSGHEGLLALPATPQQLRDDRASGLAAAASHSVAG